MTNKQFYQGLLFFGLLLITSCQLIGLEQTNTENTQQRPSIAVLPFEDMSSDKNQTYFGDGIAEEILNTLVNLKALNVAGRTSSFSFKNQEATIEEIGRALKVDHILEGSVRKEGDKIRITAQLIKVADGFHLWSNNYDRQFKDIFTIQDEVAQNIGETLLEKLTPEQLSEITAQPAKSSEAYDLCLRAKHIHLNRYYGNYNIKDFNLSERLFLKAIELDTNYALAYAGLADLYDSHKDALSDPEELKRYDFLKIKNSERAWQLNPDLPYVNIVRGWVMRNKKVEQNDLDAAYESFRRGYELNPTSSDGLFGLAFLYEDKSLMADADKLLAKAIQLDPFRSTHPSVKGDFLMRSGKYDLAIKETLAALQINPADLYALSVLAMSYAFSNKMDKALTTYRQIDQIDPSFLKKSVVDKKMYALAQGEVEAAKAIPTSLLNYRGENVIIDGLVGKEVALKKSFLAWWDWWQNFKGTKVFAQSCAYTELQNHVIYAPIRNKPWFQEIVKKEKEKYDAFYAKFPRAEEILAIAPTKENKPILQPMLALKQYGFYLLSALLIGLGSYFWLTSQRQKKKELSENQANREVVIPGEEVITPFVKKLKSVIENNIDNTDFSLAQLCRAMNLSRAQLYRKIKAQTGTSPALYIRDLRLQKAKQLLQTTDLNITEITYQVGFKDLSYFSRSFSEKYGIAPSETRK